MVFGSRAVSGLGLALLFFAVLLFGFGCITNQDGDQDDLDFTNQTINGTTIIPLGGGTVLLPSVAIATFPNESFTAPREAKIEKTSSPETADDFRLTATPFSPGKKLDYEVRVNSGQSAPLKDVYVTVFVPKEFADSLPISSEMQMYVQIFEETESEELYSFELISSTFNTETNALGAVVPKEAFTNIMREDEMFEAVIVVAQSGETLVGESVEAGSSLSLAEQSVAKCEAAEIGTPLKTLKINDPFNGVTHKGVDYDVKIGDDVMAVADGTIIQIDYQIGTKKNKRQEDDLKLKIVGWGKHVIIKHTDGSYSIYAHLLNNSPESLGMTVGKKITKGTVIGKADSTGGVTGPHLHLEYVKAGKGVEKKNKINPAPCVEKEKTGSVTVSGTCTVKKELNHMFDGTWREMGIRYAQTYELKMSGSMTGSEGVQFFLSTEPTLSGSGTLNCGSWEVSQTMRTCTREAGMPETSQWEYIIVTEGENINFAEYSVEAHAQMTINYRPKDLESATIVCSTVEY
ncbi:MAG: M23 family metallopeptidase [Candidatus Micrarchaeota archaeon]